MRKCKRQQQTTFQLLALPITWINKSRCSCKQNTVVSREWGHTAFHLVVIWISGLHSCIWNWLKPSFVHKGGASRLFCCFLNLIRETNGLTSCEIKSFLIHRSLSLGHWFRTSTPAAEYLAMCNVRTNLTPFCTPRTFSGRPQIHLQWACCLFFSSTRLLSFMEWCELFTNSSGDLTSELHCIAVAGHFCHAILFHHLLCISDGCKEQDVNMTKEKAT